MRGQKTDKLDLCQSIVGFLLGGTLLLALTLCFCSVSRRSVSYSSRDLVDSLDLTVLSLVPSGQIARHPEIQHVGVDMRMTPSLPSIQINSSSLLLSVDQL